MSETVQDPIFARVYHCMSPKAEEAGEAEHRPELLADLHGRVLEVGAGNGLKFEHYPPSVVAVEPEAYLRERAVEAAAIERAGFETENCRRFDFRATPLVAAAAPRILLTARRPQEDSR